MSKTDIDLRVDVRIRMHMQVCVCACVCARVCACVCGGRIRRAALKRPLESISAIGIGIR
jgi:hypothetical protein